ncbi:MAG: 2'-5' RNA ligase family protein [Treponema sp.]|nr:2'-5' RNA ligase family protein [Treponema sp.]
MTIGAFRGAKESMSKVIQCVEDFSKAQKPSIVNFMKIESFKEKAVILLPERTSFLLDANKELHRIILQEFEKGENGYYLPEQWVPHTTLATKLNKRQFIQSLEIAKKIPLPLCTEATEISVYQSSPFTELKRLELVSN